MKNKLIMTLGLPGSGKSTWAFEEVKNSGGKTKRVNKDDLRAMIDGGKWSRKNEEIIKSSEIDLVQKFLKLGNNVIVDNTNFAYQDFWKQFALDMDVDFEVKFFDTPLLECIARDARRGDKAVGQDVIMRMYDQFLKPKLVEHLTTVPDCYLVDIDGTVALMQNRSPFEWSRVGEDLLNRDVAETVRKLERNTEIIFMSGRDSVCRKETEEWLERNGFVYKELFMRTEGDNRKDSIVKKELYENNILGKYNVIGVIDDREQVVSVWRSLGLTCFQCDYGKF